MKKTLFTITMVTITLAMSAQPINYPVTARDNTVDEYFGTKVPDPYRWLENDTSAQTARWVEAENAVTNEYLKRMPQRKHVLERLHEVANYERTGIPFEKHGKWYFYKNDGLHCVPFNVL